MQKSIEWKDNGSEKSDEFGYLEGQLSSSGGNSLFAELKNTKGKEPENSQGGELPPYWEENSQAPLYDEEEENQNWLNEMAGWEEEAHQYYHQVNNLQREIED